MSSFGAGKREEWPRPNGGPGGTEGVNPSRTYALAASGIQPTEGAGPIDTVGLRAAADKALAEREAAVYTPAGRREA